MAQIIKIFEEFKSNDEIWNDFLNSFNKRYGNFCDIDTYDKIERSEGISLNILKKYHFH